ncbi:Transposon Ty3-I Gag-Pol polyprotein [Vitis vinifera]|uniref:Transposon Ty3-I Gag-Pol polyprotein n=1 Tax=Vitis vinifera TaxID=29760 RepID=A0A438CXL6_VITVI|nr:Transposon Ty3-I Gag-Pol polyprotein [Vitis vinifera]
MLDRLSGNREDCTLDGVYRDLNKASPKDDFPLSHIDMLVDSTAGHSMLSFMDGFSGYNNILMAPKDMEKTSFIIEWGTYCYRVMPFGLKNARATYQRVATILFHDMMHKDVEFRLRLNPKKCTFGVTSGKLLEHIVSERGIEVDPEKIRAILDMPASRTEREETETLCDRVLHMLSLTIRSTEISVRHACFDWWAHEMDGVANQLGFGIVILLISPKGDHIPRSIRLAFFDHHWLTNNVVEYEACITDRATTDRVMREVHAGVCGPHMGGHMLARKIMRIDYFWLTMETDYYQFCGGVDVIGKVSPKSSSGHEYILVAIDYFTKWVNTASYASLTTAKVVKFIRSHIIYQYGIPHELIPNRGVHLRSGVDTLVPKYGIQYHRSSAYKPQTNGTVEAVNKNIKRILRKMVETSQNWATPFSLVYGMEVVLPIEIEVGSLRITLEHQIAETDWLQARYDQLNLLDEKRLRTTYHMHAYQRKMVCAFKKRVKPRKFHKGDLVLRVLRGLINDPKGKF